MKICQALVMNAMSLQWDYRQKGEEEVMRENVDDVGRNSDFVKRARQRTPIVVWISYCVCYNDVDTTYHHVMHSRETVATACHEVRSRFKASEAGRLRSVQTWCSQLMRRLPRG